MNNWGRQPVNGVNNTECCFSEMGVGIDVERMRGQTVFRMC